MPAPSNRSHTHLRRTSPTSSHRDFGRRRAALIFSIATASLGCSPRDPSVEPHTQRDADALDTAADGPLTSIADTGDDAWPDTGEHWEDDTGEPTRGAPPQRISRTPDLPAFSARASPVGRSADRRQGFGPRRLDTENRDDFHAGVDYFADIGEPVFAIDDGVVYLADPASSSGDANTLYIAHALPTFSWQGTDVDTVYGVYSHISGFAVADGDTVQAGQVVGWVGDTGARNPHLHYETRLGYPCTLRYGVDHPESTCAGPFDPAINPLHFVPGRIDGGLDVQLVSQEPLQLTVRTSDEDWDLSRIESPLGVVDFDARAGMDATSSDRLDDFDFGWLRVVPDETDAEPAHQTWTLHLDPSTEWIEVTDIRGEGWRITP